MDPLLRSRDRGVVARCSHAPRRCVIIAGPLGIAFVKSPEPAAEFLPAEGIVTE